MSHLYSINWRRRWFAFANHFVHIIAPVISGCAVRYCLLA
ncbi:type I toxin-antitoxin system Fst family toxin [Staphylococcus aureus]